MMRPWRWWLTRCSREEDARPLAMVRILLAACVVGDLLRAATLQLWPHLFRTYAAGGLSKIQDPHLIIESISPQYAGMVAALIVVIAMAMVGLGVCTRPALVVGILAYAQLGHLYPPGDRAIDRLIRTVLLCILFSGAHRRFALGGGPRLDRIKAWPSDIIKFVLVLMYVSAGTSKLIATHRWLSLDGDPPLYRILADPMASYIDPIGAADWIWLFRIGSFATIIIELTAPFILTRWCHWWALVGLLMHVGIAATMKLGMFSWGMLGLYPLLLAPWFISLLDRLSVGRSVPSR